MRSILNFLIRLFENSSKMWKNTENIALVDRGRENKFLRFDFVIFTYFLKPNKVRSSFIFRNPEAKIANPSPLTN